MAKYINPFTDWGFKRLFGQEFSKDLLISFLNDLLEGELHVKDVVFKDKEQLPQTKDQRGIIYDVFCETDTGERFILEMQNKWQPNFLDRSICYACRSILEQVDKGKAENQDAYKFLPIYTVCFMNYMPKAGEVNKFRTDIRRARSKLPTSFASSTWPCLFSKKSQRNVRVILINGFMY